MSKNENWISIRRECILLQFMKIKIIAKQKIKKDKEKNSVKNEKYPSPVREMVRTENCSNSKDFP